MTDGRRAALTSLVFGFLAVGCGDDPAAPQVGCSLSVLPLAAEADGPVLTDVALEVQDGEGIVVLATATDPQGSEDLRNVQQSIGVFRTDQCEGDPIVVRDDLAGSGLEESFGTAIGAVAETALFERISAADTWPVEVEFRDVGGHTTSGRVAARVVR